jgi:hypothetical protein
MHNILNYKGRWTVGVLTKKGRMLTDPYESYESETLTQRRCEELSQINALVLKDTNSPDKTLFDTMNTWKIDAKDVLMFMPVPYKN